MVGLFIARRVPEAVDIEDFLNALGVMTKVEWRRLRRLLAEGNFALLAA
jgi:hypothetical protein